MGTTENETCADGFPKNYGGWELCSSDGTDSCHYRKGGIHSLISPAPDGTGFNIAIGIYIPARATLARMTAPTMREALDAMAAWEKG